ncbi:phosphoribosylanthranilate isomerase [Candidatus Pelagibacter sp.]|nr:phosphoribosylanthranilate isomerase [Candidatus Pelagibacter sp.]
MTLKCKICGISDSKTLNFIINHKYPPQFIGFIVNYPKSRRFIEFEKLNNLINIDKKKISFVAVLVKPNYEILERIKDLNFDFYQIYDCTPEEIKYIRQKYRKKIITAITVENNNDINKYKQYLDVTDIYLFDSKGYEKSLSFDHSLIKNLNIKKELMLAGDISIDDNLENYKKIANIIDISGSLETSGLKDNSKIEIFLNKLKLVNNET